MKKLGIVLLLLAAAYAGGFVQAYLEKREVEAELKAVTTDLEACHERSRIAGVMVRLLAVEDAARNRNYGDAQALASEFFEAARDLEASATLRPAKEALADILGQRDSVIVALTQADATVVDALKGFEMRLREALGFAVPQTASAPAPTAEARPTP